MRRDWLTDTLENMEQGVVTVDDELMVVASNQRAVAILDIPPKMLAHGASFRDVILYLAKRGDYGPGDPVKLSQEFSAVARGRTRVRFERSRFDGSVIVVRGNPIPGGGFVFTYSDITDRKRAEEELLVAKEHAELANRAKSEFLAAMSHELRTPLNAVIGFSEIIKDETFGPVGSTKYRDYADDIHESGQHLLGLINDILDMSKIESGTDELHEENIDFSEIANATLRLVEQRAEQGGINLELEFSDQLPALYADKRKLKQILVNLLSNAVKFTEAGGKVTLRAWCRRDSGYVFQIVDTGIGIDSEDIPKALSRFGQVHADLNRRYEGIGLGLPLTKALVELHGGSLDLQSKAGVGTTVTVRFPATRIVTPPDNSDSLDVEARRAAR